MAAETVHWFLSALIGAVTAVLVGVPLEHYKRHRDRRSVAAVIGAEISGLQRVTKENDTVKLFEQVLTVLQTMDVPLPKIFTMEPEYGPLFEKNIERIGLLPVDVAERVVLFYGYLVGVRVSLRNLIDTDWTVTPDPKAAKATQIRVGLKLWRDMDATANTLVGELRMIAQESWWTKAIRLIRARIETSLHRE